MPETAWRDAMAAHEARLGSILEAHLQRRSRGQKAPVMDFLFEYYRFRPSRLRKWTPGFGIALQGHAAEAFLENPLFGRTEVGMALDPARLSEKRKKGIRWMREVIAQTQNRAPFFGCGGMHEWAMVYKSEEIRHSQVPLRMTPAALAAFVESQPVVCSHFDAFRFFTPEARPLNQHQPTHDAMVALEQPGCLHANMDVYRWAFKLYPWVPSELLADAFLLACRIREVDMRASPYDLEAFGIEPIFIETPEGRRTYQQHQRQFMQEAAPLRARLLDVYDRLISFF